MLGQLLCIDRRYQRMNCFNIREAQSILKREFFTDLVHSNDYHELLSSTMLNFRYKTGSDSPLNTNFLNFINYGTSVNTLQTEYNYMNFINYNINKDTLDNIYIDILQPVNSLSCNTYSIYYYKD